MAAAITGELKPGQVVFNGIDGRSTNVKLHTIAKVPMTVVRLPNPLRHSSFTGNSSGESSIEMDLYPAHKQEIAYELYSANSFIDRVNK